MKINNFGFLEARTYTSGIDVYIAVSKIQAIHEDPDKSGISILLSDSHIEIYGTAKEYFDALAEYMKTE